MDQTRADLIPNPAVRRLSLYLRQLEAFKRKDRRTISSKQLGESLNLTDAQVRKDLAYFGQFGHPGIGYRVDELIAKVRQILGTDKTWNVLLVGAGNLGRALMAYHGFDAKGFRLVAVFDNDSTKTGKKQGNFAIQPLASWPKRSAGRTFAWGSSPCRGMWLRTLRISSWPREFGDCSTSLRSRSTFRRRSRSMRSILRCNWSRFHFRSVCLR